MTPELHHRASLLAYPTGVLVPLLPMAVGIVLLYANADVRQLTDNTRQLALVSAVHLESTARAIEQSQQTTTHLRTALQSSQNTMTATSRFLASLHERQHDYDLLLQRTNTLANALEQSKIFLWKINWILKKFGSGDLVPSLDRALMDVAKTLWSGGKWIETHGPGIIEHSLRTLSASELALRALSKQLELTRSRDLPLVADQCQHARKTIDDSALAARAAEQALASLQSEQLPLTVQTLRQNADHLRNLAKPVTTAAWLYVSLAYVLLLLGASSLVMTLVGLFSTRFSKHL